MFAALFGFDFTHFDVISIRAKLSDNTRMAHNRHTTGTQVADDSLKQRYG